MGEAKVGEVVGKGRINMVVALALRTGRNTSAQAEGTNQAVEAGSLGVVKQVVYSFISGSASTKLFHHHSYSCCRGFKEG